MIMNTNVQNGLQIFNNPKFGNIRALEINKDPYFVGRDVAACLGYAKPENAIRQHVDNEDTLKQGIPDNQGFTQTTILINESGVYSLVFGSKLPTAKDFKRWVTKDVLPSIRKTGGYIIEKEGDTDEDILSRALLIAQNKIKDREQRITLLEEENRLNKEQIKESAPKVQYYEEVLQSKSTYTTTQIAKELGFKSAEKLNLDLKKRKIQFFQSGQWMLTSKYAGQGFTKNKTTPFLHSDGRSGSNTIMVWTETGRKFLHDLYNIHE